MVTGMVPYHARSFQEVEKCLYVHCFEEVEKCLYVHTSAGVMFVGYDCTLYVHTPVTFHFKCVIEQEMGFFILYTQKS